VLKLAHLSRRDINLTLFLLSAFQSSAGQAVSAVAFIYLIHSITNSASAMALTLLFKYIPYIIMPFFSSFLDRFASNKILIVNNLIAGFILALVFILSYLHVILSIIVYFSAFTTGMMAAIYSPSMQRALPGLKGKNSEFRINAKISLINQMVSLVSLMLSGVLISQLGPALTILIEAGFYLLSALSLLFVHIEPMPVTTDNKLLANMISVLSNITRNKNIFIPIAILTLCSFLVSPLQVILPAYLLKMKLNAAYYTAVLSCYLICMMIGNKIYKDKLYKTNIYSLYIYSSILLSISYFLLAMISQLICVFIWMSCMGVVLSITNNASFHMLHKETSYEIKGRVFTFLFSFIQSANAISLILTSCLVGLLSYRQVLLIFVGIFIIGFALCFLTMAKHFDTKLIHKSVN